MIRTPRYRYKTLQFGDYWYPGYDRENMQTVDNQLDALISFVGPGVISGWDITKFATPTDDEDTDAIYRAEQVALIDAYDSSPTSRLGKMFSSLGLVSSLSACRVASTSNLTLSGLQKIDGVDVVAGDRILVKDQTTATQNGIYVAASGAWSRATDLDNNAEFDPNLVIRVNEGSDHEKTLWVLSPPSAGTSGSYTVGTTKIFFHNAWEQVIRVSTGTGFIGKHAARTETTVYFRLVPDTGNNVYYVWAEASHCLVTEGVGVITCPLDPDEEYNLTHTATFLGEVYVAQKSVTSTGDFRIYIDRIEYTDERRNLKNLASELQRALQDSFYRHVHAGGPDNPSKINLATRLVLNADGPLGTTIFLIKDASGNLFTWDAEDYGIPEVRLNYTVLPPSTYLIDPNAGKLYLQNSIPEGSILQVLLPLAPQKVLTIHTDSDIDHELIFLTDGESGTNSQGEPTGPGITPWDADLYHEPKVYLKDVLVDPDVTPYTLYPNRGAIAFDPPLSAASYADEDLEVVLTELKDEITGKLSGARIKDIDASTFTAGQLDLRRLRGLDHVGQVRYLEPAVVKPSLRLFSEGDHKTFYPEIVNSALQFNSEVYCLEPVRNFAGATYGLGTKRGLMLSTDLATASLQEAWIPDQGQPVQLVDNILPPGTNYFNETYLRTWEDSATPRTGRIYVTKDKGASWQRMKAPTISTATGIDTALATAFSVTTDKQQVNGDILVTYEYYRVFYLGTDKGLWSAQVKEGLADDEWEWSQVSYIPQNTVVHCVLELVTLHQTWDGDGNLTETYDRSVYVGAETGFFVNGFLVSTAEVKHILWLQLGSDPRLHNIVWATDHEVFVTHTSERIATSNSIHYNHPLAYFQSGALDEHTVATAATTANISNLAAASLTIDGVTFAVGHRVLVKNQTNAVQNGIYEVTAVGGSTVTLTRAADMAAASSVDSTHYVRVANGSINGGSVWQVNVTGTKTVGTDAIPWKDIYFRAVRDESRTFLNLHQRTFDPSNYFALSDKGIYRIIDPYDSVTSTWGSISSNLLDWEEEHQGQARDMVSVTGGDYGVLYVASDKGIWKSGNGLWDSLSSAAPWTRVTSHFLESHEPTVYNALTGEEFLSEPFGTAGATLVHNVAFQSFIFDTARPLYENFVYEKDYQKFYVAPWNSSGADVVVYIGDSASEISYLLNPELGEITFISGLTRLQAGKVKITIIRLGAFISNVGDTPHEELPNSFVTDAEHSTVLSEDFTAQDTILHVADDRAIPVDVDYLELRTTLTKERINVTIDPATRQISLAKPRSGTTTFPATVTKVYVVRVKSILGIEDEITKRQVNQTYHLNSLGGVNTIQLSIKGKTEFPSPELFNNFGVYPKEGTKADRGPKNALFFDFSTSEIDVTGSSSTLYVGYEATGEDDPIEPRAVYFIHAPAATGENMRVGTDQGIWIYSGGKWKKESDLSDSNTVYFIQSVSFNAGSGGGSLVAGTDTGAYSNSGSTWTLNATYPQAIFAQLDNQPWKTGFTYDAWGKDDGLAFVLYDTAENTFISDHFDALDGKRVYGLHHDQFIRISTDSSGNTTQTKVNALYLCTEDGLYAVTDGNRGGQYSSVLTGREMFGSSKKLITVELPNGGQTTVPVKFYKITKSTRPNSIPFILLSNNGIYIVRNWRWCDPDPTRIPVLDFYSEAHKLAGVSCYCYAHDSDIGPPDIYKIFIGTNKGVYRSYNDGYDWERCERIAGGDTSVYDLKIVNDTIFAATDRGLYASNDEGDTWYRPKDGLSFADFTHEISAAKQFDGGYLAQTFKPATGTTDTMKVALYLSLKDIEDEPEYEQSLNNYLTIAIYNTSSGAPTSAISPVGTPDTLFASDVEYPGFKYLNIEVTGLNPANTYAVVVKENIASGGIPIFKWHTSKVSNPYANGQAYVGGLVPTWVAQTNEDFYFRVYFDAPVTVTETTIPIGMHSNADDVGYGEGTGRGYLITDDGYMIPSAQVIGAFVVDDTKSMKWGDPASSNPRETVIPELITGLFDRTKRTLSGSLFPELAAQEFIPSYGDFWIFGRNILERTEGFTNDVEGTLEVVSSALHERGNGSEPFDAASMAFAGLYKQSIIDAIVVEDDEEGTLTRAKEVVQYLEDKNALRLNDVIAYWDALDALGEASDWGTTGGYLATNIPLYTDVRDYVIEKFAEAMVPAAFLMADGDGEGNAESAGLTAASAWDDDGVQPFIYGLGHGHKQDNLRTLVAASDGKHFDISDGTVGQDWDEAKNSFLHGGDNTLFQASWHREFDYDEPTFIRKARAKYNIPSSDSVAATCVAEVRFTLDRVNFTPWVSLPNDVDYAINEEVLGIQYRVTMTQGWTSGGSAVTPELQKLYHVEVSPAYQYLVTPTQDVSGMVFEHLLSAAVDLPRTARTTWGIIRGDSTDFADFEPIHNGRKGALPNRQSSIQFTDEEIQDKLDTITTDFHYYYVKDASGQTVTWATTDLIEVYILVNGQYQQVPPDGYDGSQGFVYFSAEQPQTQVVKVTIITPQELVITDGEATTTKDGRTYTLVNGGWPHDATAIVLVNKKIKRGGFWLNPDEGTVTFYKERERTDIVTVFIQFAPKFRVGVEIKNFDPVTPVVLDNFGLYYTVRKNLRLVFQYENTNAPEIVGEPEILPVSCTAYQRMLLEYSYYSPDGNEESETETTWWRKRPADPATYSLPADADGFYQITSENIETIGINSNALPEYNNRTLERKVDVGALSLFKTNDQVKVKVKVSDGISVGVEESTDAVTLGSNRIPYVRSVTISAGGLVEDPASSGNYYVPAGEELRAYYIFNDGEGNETTINGTTHTSTVEWFKNDGQTPISTNPKIAANTTVAGEAYSFKVTPKDATHTGTPVMSLTVVVR